VRQSAVPLALALVSAALLGGCSSGRATSATSAPNTISPAAATPAAAEPTPDESGALKKAVNGYSVAFLSGDGAGAFALLSPRCKARLSEDEMRSETKQAKTPKDNCPSRRTP
jgi:hypothetical protein